MGNAINIHEVLRYLGYKGQELSEEMSKLIDTCREEVIKISRPKYIFEYFHIEEIDNEIVLLNTNLHLKGKDIKEHLKGCNAIAVLVVTLGLDIEKHINYNEKINLTKSIILDACATTYIEEICDEVEEIIRNDMKIKNLSINSRFSPGYGDLPLDMQGELLDILSSSRRIGVTTSKHHLLFPRKSVTAIIGICEQPLQINKRDCSNCRMYETCMYRRKGENCGN